MPQAHADCLRVNGERFQSSGREVALLKEVSGVTSESILLTSCEPFTVGELAVQRKLVGRHANDVTDPAETAFSQHISDGWRLRPQQNLTGRQVAFPCNPQDVLNPSYMQGPKHLDGASMGGACFQAVQQGGDAD